MMHEQIVDQTRMEFSGRGAANQALFALLAFYFLVPHHLFTRSGEAAAVVKPFDVVVPVLALLLVGGRADYTRLRPLWLLTAWYMLRSVFALKDVGWDALLFGAKFLEYVVVAAAICSLDAHRTRQLFRLYLVATLFYVALELAGIRVGIPWDRRASGHFGGPYELSAVAMLFFAFAPLTTPQRLLMLGAVLVSGTKAGYVSLLASLLSRRSVIYAVPILVFMAFWVILFDARTMQFISDTFKSLDWELVVNTWNSIDDVGSSAQYFSEWELREASLPALEIDLSTWSRLYTYLLALKSLDAGSFLFGLGPGFFGAALDSSLLRLLGEAGLVGLFLGVRALRRLAEDIQHPARMLILLSIVALSDVLFSARFLPTLVLLARLWQSRKPAT